MRRLISIAALLACAAALAAGCGGDDDSGGALESALAYVPANTPFAVAIDTDVEGDRYQALDELLGRFPGGGSIKQSLRQQLETGDEGVSYDDDIKPLLGNPFVVSATDVASFIGNSGDTDFVAAIQVEDQDALDGLIEKTNPEEQGEVAGATVYQDGSTTFAVEDDMVVFAGSRAQLESALERADGDDHLDEDSFEQSLDDLPEDALARSYVDLRALIEQSTGGEAARRIDWVSALRTLGVTASAEGDSVDIELDLRTEDEELGEEDLPLAPGDEAAQVVQEPGELGFGLRDPSQVVDFFESAFQSAAPQDFGDYEAGKRAIEQRYDIDLDEDLFGQLTGDLSVSLALDGAFSARAEVQDADTFGQTVDRLAEALPELGAGLGVTDVTRRGELYEARLASGARFVFGMSDGAFVAASNAARALEFASKEPTEVPGASGSLVMAADAERLALRLLDQFAPQLGFGGGLFARPLDNLSGSLTTSTDGMKGSFSLTLD